jgi:UDPglucose--hexose-1-phosphate uridylyltransferase
LSVTVSKTQKTSPSLPNAEIRKHYFLDSYVVVAPKRTLRPVAVSKAGPEQAATCNFCNNSERGVWQTPRGKHWRVKVIPNAFPALSRSNPRAFGVQEVVIDTPDHDVKFSELSIENIETVFSAYRQRITELNAIDGVRYVLVFKNSGAVAGASVEHAHCQIFALPLVPPHIEHESDAMNHYWDQHKSCAYCDILNWELHQKVRIIAEDKHFVVLSPYAAGYTFEAWLIPRRHEPKFAGLGLGEQRSLATFLKKITARLDMAGISYNYFLQESLDSQDHHFVLKVEPRTTKWGGAELGTGVIINPVAPEHAALWYRGRAQ